MAIPPSNLMRSLLATPNYGLACLAWDDALSTPGNGSRYGWRWPLLGVGKPLADVMQYGMYLACFQSIIGDPTLRMDPIRPVQNVTAQRDGTTVILSWDPVPQGQNALYFVYRSEIELEGFGAPVYGGTDTTFVDTNAPAGTWYQVRVSELKTTGSGSYWDLSQGVFTVAQ